QPVGAEWPEIQHQQVIRRLLNKLYNLLIVPVVDLLPKQSGSLTIVPYGLLHNLPFHALYDGLHFLIEDFQINYLPASNMLMHLSRRRDEQASHSMDASLTPKQPLVFGYSGNGHLQRAINEADMLATMLGGQTL